MDLRNKTVLVIDDDEDLCLLLQKMLGGSGLNVVRAHDSTSGLLALKNQAPHIVLLDLNLGKENGVQFLQKKRDIPNSDLIPVIIMTAQTDKKLLTVCLSLGAVDFLLKPLSSAKLILKIKKHLKENIFPVINMKSASSIADIECDGELSHINEASCLVNSSVRIKNGTEIKLEAPILRELSIANLNFRTVGQGLYSTSGQFNNEVALLGISEEQAKKIRIMNTNVKK